MTPIMIYGDGMSPNLPEYEFYDGTIRLRFDESCWTYFLIRDGASPEPQFGVTSVLKIIDKSEPLINWALKKAFEKFKRLMIDAEAVCQDGDDLPEPPLQMSALDDLIASAKKAPREHLEDAGEVGHVAHAWIEDYVRAVIAEKEDRRLELLAKLPEDERAANSIIAALDFFDRHNVRWICTERKIYSRKHKVAGTLDGLALTDSCDDPTCCPEKFTDSTAIIDHKTSNGLYGTYLMQTAIYQESYTEETGVKIDRRFVNRLDKETAEFESWHVAGDELFQQDLAGFLNALALYKSVKQIEERIDGIKAARKEKARLDKEAARQIKCLDADKYQGKRKKKGCNKSTKMCAACEEKFLTNGGKSVTLV